MSRSVGNNFPGAPEYLEKTDEFGEESMTGEWILPNEEVPRNNQEDFTLNQLNAVKENDDFLDEKLDEIESEPLADEESFIFGEMDNEVAEARRSPKNEPSLAATLSCNMSDYDDPQSSDDTYAYLLDPETNVAELASRGMIRECEQMKDIYPPGMGKKAFKPEEVKAPLGSLNLPVMEKSGPLILEQMASATLPKNESEWAHVPPGASFVGPPAFQQYEIAPEYLASPGSPREFGSSYGSSPASESFSRSHCSSISSEYGSAPSRIDGMYLGSGPLTPENDTESLVLSASAGKIPRVRRCSRRHSTSFEGISGQKPTRCSKKEMKALSAEERKERKKAQNATNARSYKKRKENELRELRDDRDYMKNELKGLEEFENELWGEVDPEDRDALSYQRAEIAENIDSEYEETLAEKRKNVSDCRVKLEEIKSKRQFLKTKRERSTNCSQKCRQNEKLLKAKRDLEVHELEAKIELVKTFQKVLIDFVGPRWSPRSPGFIDVRDSNSAPVPYGQNPRMDDFGGNLLPAEHPPDLESFTLMDISTAYPRSGGVGGTSLARSVDRWPPISADRVEDAEFVQYYPP